MQGWFCYESNLAPSASCLLPSTMGLFKNKALKRCQHLNIVLASLQIYENMIPYELPSLWYSVIAAQSTLRQKSKGSWAQQSVQDHTWQNWNRNQHTAALPPTYIVRKYILGMWVIQLMLEVDNRTSLSQLEYWEEKCVLRLYAVEVKKETWSMD
jgi:hypothetical protein